MALAAACMTLLYTGIVAGQCTNAPSTNPCAPGTGSKKTDCHLEWRFTPMPQKLVNATPTPDARYVRFAPGGPREPLQRDRIICYEGDRRCDFDTDLDNESCTFRTELCINNSDPRFPKCVGSQPLSTFEVLHPSPFSGALTAANVANIAALEAEAGSGGLGMTVVEGINVVDPGAPNATLDTCSAPVDLIVPLGVNGLGGNAEGEERIRVRVATSAGVRDADKLRLLCRESTCGDGFIDSDHELCDDGNRSNCDVCDQGCQPNTSPTCTPTATPTQTETPTETETPTDTPTP
jgi:cysteine-rich repeat protein